MSRSCRGRTRAVVVWRAVLPVRSAAVESRSASSTICPRGPASSGVPETTESQAARTARSERQPAKSLGGHDESREQGRGALVQSVVALPDKSRFIRVRLHRPGPGVPGTKLAAALVEERDDLVHCGFADVVEQDGCEARVAPQVGLRINDLGRCTGWQ